MLATALFPSIGWACESGETRHFSCTFQDGRDLVDICHDGQQARYSFGPVSGAPELVIIVPVTEVDLTPWPGIGRTIWEEVTFLNETFSYTAIGSIERIYPEDEDGDVKTRVVGTLLVAQGGDEVARLDCDPGSVDFPWGTALFDAKMAAGQCFDHAARLWRNCPEASKVVE